MRVGGVWQQPGLGRDLGALLLVANGLWGGSAVVGEVQWVSVRGVWSGGFGTAIDVFVACSGVPRAGFMPWRRGPVGGECKLR